MATAVSALPRTTVSNPDTLASYLETHLDICAHAFSTSPVTLRFICETDGITAPPVPAFPVSRIHTHLWRLVDTLTVGYEIIEAGEWAACALWEPPQCVQATSDDEYFMANLTPARKEYFRNIISIRKQVIPDGRYWHLAMIARGRSRSEAGAVRAVIEPYLLRAEEDAAPIWLETWSPRTRDIYAHFGFEVVGQFRFSVGEANAKGELVEGGKGEGILIWVMVWWPRKRGAASRLTLEQNSS